MNKSIINIQEKNPTVIILLTILSTFFSLIIFGYLFIQFMMKYFIVVPDLDLIIKMFTNPEGCVPEPQERYLYLFVLLSLPFFIIVYYYLYRKIIKYNKIFYYELYALFSCVILGIVVFAYTSKSIYDFPDYAYVKNIFFHPLIYMIIIGFILLQFFNKNCYQFYKNSIIFNYTKKYISRFNEITILILIVFVFFWYWRGARIAWFYYHYEAVIYSIAQVVNGKGILVDFVNQYGLYPLFIAPIIRLTGFSVISVTGILSALAALSYFCIYKYLKNIIKTKFIVIIGFISFLYLYLFQKFKLWGDPSYQYATIRFLSPCILLGMGAYYFKKPKKVVYYSLLVICSLSVLWNFDSGIVVYITFLLTLIYSEIIDIDSSGNKFTISIKIIKKSTVHIIKSIIILISFILLFYLFSYIKYNTFPNLKNFFSYQLLFANYGFFCLPMPKYHPWIIYAAVHIIGLSIAVNSIFTKKNKYLAIVIFMTSILGCGLFSYYQGRSHDVNYYCIRHTGILLGIIYLDLLFRAVRYRQFSKKRLIIGETILFSSLLFYFLSPLFNCFDKESFYAFFVEGKTNLVGIIKNENFVLEKQIEFIRRYTLPGEEVVIISNFQGNLYGYTSTSNPVKIPGLFELIRREDWYTLLEFIEKNDVKLFIQTSYLERADLAATVYLNYIIEDSIDEGGWEGELRYYKYIGNTSALP